jgi:hypothetical protein
MITPAYIRWQEPAHRPDIYGAVYDFIDAWAAPPMDPDNIYRDMVNRAALPAASNDYAVISILNTVRHGTNVERLHNTGADDESPELSAVCVLDEATVQCDFVSNGEAARQRAMVLENLTRSSVGVAFFKPYHISACYADDVKEIPYIDESKQYVHRFMTVLHLTYWAVNHVGSAWLTTVDLRTEDVDTIFNRPAPEGDSH